MEENFELINKAKAGDEESIEQVLSSYEWLIIYSAGKYIRNGNKEQVLHYGRIGLFVALDKYDPSMGFKFSSFAEWSVQKEVLDSFNFEREIRIPYAEKTLIKRIFRQIGDYVASNGKEPSYEIIADMLNQEEENKNTKNNNGNKSNNDNMKEKYSGDKVKSVIKQYEDSLTRSYNKPLRPGEENTLLDLLGCSDESICQILEHNELSEIIYEHLNDLDPKSKFVVEMLYLEKHSFSEVADMLKISVSSVKTSLAISMRILRSRMSSDSRLESYLCSLS